MIKRPDRSETEEDLLRLQQEYLAKKQKPSVSLKLSNDPKDIKDTFQGNEKTVTTGKGERFYIDFDDLKNASKRLDEKEKRHVSTILSDIKEKDISRMNQALPKHYKKGFPTAPVFDKNCLPSTNTSFETLKGKKRSLFAQKFSQSCNPSIFDEVSIKSGSSSNGITETTSLGDQKEYIVIEETESNFFIPDSPLTSNELSKPIDDIAKENRETLSEMSEKEILEEQNRLLSTLDPKIVTFLKTKRKSSKTLKHLDRPINTESIIGEKYADHERREDDIESTFNNPKDDQAICEMDPHTEFGIRKGYLNMDIVEKEKLEWMKKLPKVSMKKEKITPRFDFEGCLLSPEEDVDTNISLHHHGEEPDMPGYALKELFHMIRSNFPQQRVFGLEVLAKIVEKYHQHQFVERLSADLLIQCLDAGLLFILRWSLDDQSEQIHSAALCCLAKLFYVVNDQGLVDKLFYSEEGFIVPSLCTFYKKKKEEMTQEEQEEDRDFTDAELVERDVIQGLLQMQLLPRMRYLIRICSTSKAAVNNCLLVLIRIIQHDSQCAHRVFQCPGLISVVMNLFFTEDSTEVQIYTLKFLKCLCLSGKQTCQDLISSHSLLEVITRIMSATKLIAGCDRLHFAQYTTVCHLWSILLVYEISCDLVRELHSVLMQHLTNICAEYSFLDDTAMASTVILVQQIFVAGRRKKIEWSTIDGFFPVVQFGLKKIICDLLKNKKVTHPLYLSSLLRCCQQYFTSQYEMVNVSDKVGLLDDVQTFWTQNIEKLFLSGLLHDFLQDETLYSEISCCKSNNTNKNSKIPNLPMYGTFCVVEGESHCSPLGDSLLFLVQALLKTIVELLKIAKQLTPKISGLITSPEFLAYCKKFLDARHQKGSAFGVLTKVQVLTIHHMLAIFYQVGTFCGFELFSDGVTNMMLEVASHFLCLFHVNEKALASEIMKCIIFNDKIYRRHQPVARLLGESGDKLTLLLDKARKDLHVTGGMYLQILFGKEREALPKVITSTLLTSSMQNTAAPSDWMFLPIVQLYNHSLDLELAGRIIAKASHEAVNILNSCLHFVLLLEATKPLMLTGVNKMLRLTRFICVFLTEGNLYKEEMLEDVLAALVAICSSSLYVCGLNLEDNIPGVSSFYDFYSTLIGEYVSSSFADRSFANVVLIPMQLQFNVQYRRSVWTEHCETLRVFPIPLNKVTSDIRRFLAAEQEDDEMIKIYFKALCTSSVGTRCCPLFYLIAVHHVSQFIFSEPSQKDKQKDRRRYSMLNHIVAMKETAIRDDILNYKSFDVESEDVISRFENLPPSREMMLRNRKKIIDPPS